MTLRKDDNVKIEEKEVVSVHSEGCISCGMCTALCPEVFKFNEDNKSYAANQPKNADELERAKQSAQGCPVSVIVVKE